LSSPAEQFTTSLQRIEARADGRAAAIWRAYKAELANQIDHHGPRSPALISGLTGTILRAASELLNHEADRAIYDAAAALVSAQTGGMVSVDHQPAMNYEPWRASATGIVIGEAIRMQLAGADEQAMRARLITGKDGRSSAWELARNSLSLAVALLVWGSANGLVVRMGRATSERDGIEYQKQAIAALDARTTPICRAVNRQIRPLDKPFSTTVGPQMNPPFHHGCRTAVVLYHPSFED
jgi:hypothetical protein